MAHEQLIGEGVPHRQRSRPLRNPFGRLVKVRRQIPLESAAEQTIELGRVNPEFPRQVRRGN